MRTINADFFATSDQLTLCHFVCRAVDFGKCVVLPNRGKNKYNLMKYLLVCRTLDSFQRIKKKLPSQGNVCECHFRKIYREIGLRQVYLTSVPKFEKWKTNLNTSTNQPITEPQRFRR